MPVRLLTDAERGRLSGFPSEVSAEDLHAFFTLTGRDRTAVQATSLCLSLMVDAVILWNTVHYQGALDDLRAEGHPVNDEDLAHLSPTSYAHVNPYGRYRFDLGPRRRGASPAGDVPMVY